MISGDYYFMDSSVVRADASRESFRAKLRTEQEFLEELQSGEELRSNFKWHIFDGTVDPEMIGKRRRKAKKNDRMESLSDPDAELMSRNGKIAIPAYKAHLCVDKKNGSYSLLMDRRPPKTI
jgi:hypothetical protein